MLENIENKVKENIALRDLIMRVFCRVKPSQNN